MATKLGITLGGEELVEDLVEEEATSLIDFEMLEGFSPQEGGFGWSSAEYGGELFEVTGEINP